ncbi:hypothetical protein ABK040_014070 [Willaertia magna]
MIASTKPEPKYNTFVCCGSKCNSRQAKCRHLKKCTHFTKLRQFIESTYPQISLTELIKTLVTKRSSIERTYDPLEAAYLKMNRSIAKLIQ